MKKVFLFFPLFCCLYMVSAQAASLTSSDSDRVYWTSLLYRMASPVLRNMSRGNLVRDMPLELSPTWDGRNSRVSYMEAFGRLMAGIAPYLSLPDDETTEGRQRKELRNWALRSYAQAVDPSSNDYLLWDKEGQTLVDAAYIANSFLRAPHQLWDPLDSITKARYILKFQNLRRVDPPYTNWLLFSAMIETFLCYENASYDEYRIHSALRNIEEWYVGDGWYSDGPHFAFDYYNSFVIQPMYLEILETLRDKKSPLFQPALLSNVISRMQRYSLILERLISPEGSFPVFGRSITYRTGVFQALALLSLQEKLPKELSCGQVRSALSAVMKRMFSQSGNFGDKGYLQLGFAGHQPGISDWYTDNGSLYMASLIFLPLGLSPKNPFWTEAPENWTQKKAWSGQSFLRDHAWN